jgi:hypothetical protein
MAVRQTRSPQIARKPAKLLAETVNNKVHGISASLYHFNIYNEQRNLYASFET